MSEITPAQARDMVYARLGRAPQDALEAAVVLEAWGGVRPAAALKLGDQAAAFDPRRIDHGRAMGRRSLGADKGVLAEGMALLAAVVAVALWTRPLGDAIGTATWEGAVRSALPLTLGLQWLLRSRYLGRPNGLASLRRDWSVRLFVLVILGFIALRLGLREQVAMLLIVTWVGGPVIIRRGWGLAYVLLLIGVSVAVNVGVDALAVLTGAGAVTMLGVVVSLRTAEAGHDVPGRMRRATAAGLMGVGIGGLLVGDTTIAWGTQGALPALALVPSAVGSFWGGIYLWRFQVELPRALIGVPVAKADRPTFGGPAMEALSGALLRLVVVTAVLSGIVLLAVPYVSPTSSVQGSAVTHRPADPTPLAAPKDGRGVRFTPIALTAPARSAQDSRHAHAGDIALLLGFGLVALATLMISLLQSLGRPARALLSVFCGLGAEVGLGLWGGAPPPGAGLIVGALVVVMLALPPAISLCLRSGRLLATMMWIQ